MAGPWSACLWVAAAFVLGACDSFSRTSTSLVVFAASSLTDAFSDLEKGFEGAHPDVDLRLTLAGSQVLRLQLEQGARADLFASANPQHVEALRLAGHVSSSRVFALNELAVIVPVGNPAQIEDFSSLDEAETIVLGSPNVPVGAYTRQVLEQAREQLGEGFVARVSRRVVSEETSVRLVRAKVELGEADAAIVYRTDAISSERVSMVPIPPPLNATARYRIGALTESERPREVHRFLSYLASAEGQRVLRAHGFRTVEE